MLASQDDVVSGKATEDGNNGIDNWVKAGAIAARAVLLDWASWRVKTGQSTLPANERSEIPLSELLQVAQHQGVEFQPGDLLIVRSGFLKWLLNAEESSRRLDKSARLIGVEGTEEMVKWLWFVRLCLGQSFANMLYT